MVTTRYSNQHGSKSRQNPCQVQPAENIESLSASRHAFEYELQLLLFGVQPVVQNLNYKLQRHKQRGLSDVQLIRQSNKKILKQNLAIEGYTKTNYATIRGNDTGQCQNGLSNLLTPYRAQPRSTRIVVAYPRPAFSATKRTNHAPINFDE